MKELLKSRIPHSEKRHESASVYGCIDIRYTDPKIEALRRKTRVDLFQGGRPSPNPRAYLDIFKGISSSNLTKSELAALLNFINQQLKTHGASQYQLIFVDSWEYHNLNCGIYFSNEPALNEFLHRLSIPKRRVPILRKRSSDNHWIDGEGVDWGTRTHDKNQPHLANGRLRNCK